MKRKTIKRSALSSTKMTTGGEDKIRAVILDGIVMRWVGIGWVDEGKPTAKQRASLPVAV